MAWEENSSTYFTNFKKVLESWKKIGSLKTNSWCHYLKVLIPCLLVWVILPRNQVGIIVFTENTLNLYHPIKNIT